MFGVADYWAFVIAVIVFLAIPGVGNLAIITSTSKGRIAGGLAATFGVIVGDQVLMWLAVAGVATLLQASPRLFGMLQWGGAAYLAWIGWRLWVAKPGDAPSTPVPSSSITPESPPWLATMPGLLQLCESASTPSASSASRMRKSPSRSGGRVARSRPSAV